MTSQGSLLWSDTAKEKLKKNVGDKEAKKTFRVHFKHAKKHWHDKWAFVHTLNLRFNKYKIVSLQEVLELNINE
jgi:hypothetical protein